MTTDTDYDWPTEDDETWAARVQVEVAVTHHMAVTHIESELRAVHDAVVDTGSTAEELFGPAEEYAGELARAVPATVRAAESTWPLSGVLITVGLVTVIGATLAYLDGGWSVELTARSTVIAAAIVLMFVLSTLAVRLWTNGRRGAAGLVAVATVGVVGGGPALAFGLPERDQVLGTVPVALVALVGVGLLVLGFWWPDPPEAVESEAVGTPDEYFGRMEGLLRGRHHLSAEMAREQTTRAREHWAASGAEHPFEEFGAPQSYTLELADQTTESSTRRRYLHLGFVAICALIVAERVGSNVTGDIGTGTWVVLGLLALGITIWVVGAVLVRRKPRDRSVK